MAIVYYKSKIGASIGRYFYTAESLEMFISRLRKPAIIKDSIGNIIGRVTKDNNHWLWVFDPSVFTKG